MVATRPKLARYRFSTGPSPIRYARCMLVRNGSPARSSLKLGFVAACLAGDQHALSQLSNLCTGFLRSFLRKHGASDDEAEEICSEIFCECVAGWKGQRSLLLMYGAQAALSTWLARIAHNRFIDARRRDRTRSRMLEECQVDLENALTANQTRRLNITDGTHLALIRESVRQALSRCSPEDTAMLRLVYCHGISQRHVAKLWGWTECRVSRHLRELRGVVQQVALSEVRRRDRSIELDFGSVLEAFRAGD